MTSKLSNEWQVFRRSEPGKRFQDRYWRHRESARKRSRLSRFVFFALGGLSVGFGVILLFMPGPGVLFIAIGAALVGNESLIASRSFDWIEIKCRAGVAKFKKWRARRRGNV